ncbi:MAG: hypothetical protein Q7J10_07725 [Methanosarcinaceae archaeon]|nr:hypothetical protein [Methanosarcinaceae archaeon]
MGLKESLESTLFAIIASALLIIVTIVYFGITLWVVKVGSEMFFGPGLETNYAVLAAALLSASGVLGGALKENVIIA